MRKLKSAVTIVILAGVAPCTEAQIGHLWIFDELLGKAQVVVVAQCLGTVDTGRLPNHPGLSPGVPVIEMRTVANGGSVLQLQEKRNYLLLLTRQADGSYEPLSGHTFPSDSVYRLENGP
jgi:hypothetical protein